MLMASDLDQALASLAHYWESGNFVLHCWKDKEKDILNNCSIYDLKERMTIRVEDDRLSYALKQRMRESGVPIVRELPPGKNVLEKAVAELMEIGMDGEQLSEAHEELKDMKERGAGEEAIENRLKDIKRDFLAKRTITLLGLDATDEEIQKALDALYNKSPDNMN
jgi:hypothetical protein